MVAETYKHDGTDFQLITEMMYTDDTLTDRNLTEMWENDGGLWRKVFETTAIDELSLIGRTIVSSRNTIGGSSTATSSYQLTTDGIARQRVNTNSGTDSTTTSDLSGDDWWTGKPEVAIGSSYEVMATQTATNGTGTLTATLGVWTTISSLETFTLQDTGASVEREGTRTLLIEIGLVGTSTTLESASINLETQLFGP